MTFRMNHRRWFWTILGLFTVVRLLIAGKFGLSTDESHYALYGRNLAWGYFDHPPMVGFLAAATTFFGENPFLWRLGPILTWSVSAIVLNRLALTLYRDERIAFWALVFLILMPLNHLLAIALLPDATLNLFWCLALLFYWQAFKVGRWRSWILGGVCFGLALLSKYHGVLLPMCLFGYALSGRETRRWFASPKPYVSGLTGMLVFLPNILWNMQHDWISYKFQLGHGGGSGHFKIQKLLESLGGPLISATPILFVLIVISWIVLIRTNDRREEDRFVLWTSLPVFVFFCGIGLIGKVLPHWPAVGLWTGAVALARVTFDGKRTRRWRAWCVGGGVLAGLSVLLMYLMITLPVIEPMYKAVARLSSRLPFVKTLEPFRPEIDITNDLYGWEEAGKWVEQLRADMPEPDRTFIFCHRFFTTSQLAVYLGRHTHATSLNSRPSQYWLWFDAKEYAGWDAIFIDHNHWPQGGARYSHLFDETTDPVKPFAENIIERNGKVAHRLRAYRYRGFKGKIEGEE